MIEAKGAVLVHAPADLCFDDWSHFNRLPQWVPFVDAVTSIDKGNRWLWQVVHPLGHTIAWEVQMTIVVPNTQLIWRPLSSDYKEPIGITGNVMFHMLDSYTTQIKAKMGFETNADLAACWYQVLVNPDKALHIALSKFKNRAELRTLRPLLQLNR